MGLSRKTHNGFTHRIGFHFLLCQFVEILHEVTIGDRLAWRGASRGGRISFHKPNLFGGDRGEGGASGNLDFLPGGPDQQQNDYLRAMLGDFVPAYREAASVVARHVDIGKNYYPKPWKFKASNIKNTFDQWYPEKAVVRTIYKAENVSIFIALDVSGSMDGAKQVAQKAAVVSLLSSLRGGLCNVKIVTFSSAVVSSIERFSTTASDYDDLIAFVESLPNSTSLMGTDYAAAISLAPDFYDSADAAPGSLLDVKFDFGFGTPDTGPGNDGFRRVMLFLTDGAPSPVSSVVDAISTRDAIEGLELFAFNVGLVDTTYTEMLDNTERDAVPVIDGGNAAALLDAIGYPFIWWRDMNPAHILRDIILDPEGGGVGDVAQVGASFYAAADVLYDEGFGLSFAPQQGMTVSDYIKMIERHIDGIVYYGRQSGAIELKLNRGGYDVSALPVFAAEDIDGWVSAPTAPLQDELTNYVTVSYNKKETGDKAAVSRGDERALQDPPVIRRRQVEYKGIWDDALALRVCERDLRAFGKALTSGAFSTTRADPDLDVGDLIKVSDSVLGLDGLVCRVTEIDEGEWTDPKVVVRFVEDAFDLGAGVDLSDLDEGQDVSRRALASTHRLVEEVPYYLLVQALGQSDIDQDLTDQPLLGFLHTTADRPTGQHVNINVATSDGGGWEDSGYTDYAPVVTLLTPLSPSADSVLALIENVASLGEVSKFTLCKIDEEYLRVDNLTLVSGGVEISFGRGCLDTVPSAHDVGAAVIFFEDFAESNEVQYFSSEELGVKLRGVTGQEVLSVSGAPVDSVIFSHRAIRPYPVGDFRANGSYVYTHAGGDVILTWAHRDRTLQTTVPTPLTTSVPEDHTVGNIGPEAGVSYQVRIEALGAGGASLGLVVDTNVAQATTYTFIGSTSLPPGTQRLAFRVKSLRDGYENWQTPEIIAPLLAAPTGLVGVETIAAPSGLSGSII